MNLHLSLFFFFNDTATTEIYTLSLHDALPIWFPLHRRARHGRARLPLQPPQVRPPVRDGRPDGDRVLRDPRRRSRGRSEEHTSELQSRQYLVCRLLLEKKKKRKCNPRSVTLTG